MCLLNAYPKSGVFSVDDIQNLLITLKAIFPKMVHVARKYIYYIKCLYQILHTLSNFQTSVNIKIFLKINCNPYKMDIGDSFTST